MVCCATTNVAVDESVEGAGVAVGTAISKSLVAEDRHLRVRIHVRDVSSWTSCNERC